MVECGYGGDEPVWSKTDWEKHFNYKSGMHRYDKGSYGFRNDKMIDILKKHLKDLKIDGDSFKVFEFAGAGGFLARRILKNFDVKSYFHTDYADTPIDVAKDVLKDYPQVKIGKLDAINEPIDLDSFNLVVSTSTGYIFNHMELFKKLKPGTLVLISFPKGWTSNHMIRFPSEYAIIKHFEGIIDFMDIEHIVFLERTGKTRIAYYLSKKSGLYFHKNFLTEKYVCLGTICK